ncbi:MAG TPA: NUDIX domain-containing protein [Chloroflexi bacterium]|jgi:hypothetical protein|nr:NUDIX domain-containing protein [Chloroflexota bacterium]
MTLCPDLYPVVDDENRYLYCTDRQTIERDALPHRVVWGMMYSPGRDAWLVQWRRPTKFFCPNLWDISCAGHVNCISGDEPAPESYPDAYRREMAEELRLSTHVIGAESWPAVCDTDLTGSVLSIDIGLSKEYHHYPTPDGEPQWAKEHAYLFLSLYDGEVTLSPDAEPQAIAWLTATQIRDELIAPGRATGALEMMLRRCTAFAREVLRLNPSI